MLRLEPIVEPAPGRVGKHRRAVTPPDQGPRLALQGADDVLPVDKDPLGAPVAFGASDPRAIPPELQLSLVPPDPEAFASETRRHRVGWAAPPHHRLVVLGQGVDVQGP